MGRMRQPVKTVEGFLWLVWHFVKTDTIIGAGLDTAALWAMQDQPFWEFDL